MSAGLIVVLTLVLGPYLLMNAVRVARGKRWAITYCTVLKEVDLASQAARREARLSGAAATSGSARAAARRPARAPR